MDSGKGNEDKLREAACFGDEEAVKKLIDKGVNINSQHEINGWTALHWAAKRGHAGIVTYLMSRGANKSVTTKKGEFAAMLTDNEEIAKLLDVPGMGVFKSEEKLPIIPSYIAYPPVQYKVDVDTNPKSPAPFQNGTQSSLHSVQQPTPELSHHAHPLSSNEELVLKVRVACAPDPDFIEVELPVHQLTFSRLLKVCCDELQLDPSHIYKIRKLPDTVLRKDKDVQRLNNFQELELVTTGGSSRFGADNKCVLSPHAAVQPKSGFANCKIFY